VHSFSPTAGGSCPDVRRAQGKFGGADAPLDAQWTEYHRRDLPPLTSNDCCYRWCAPLSVHDADGMQGRELQCDKLRPRGVECIDVRTGPSRFPASAQYAECPAGLNNVGSGQLGGAYVYAVFSTSMTAAFRSEGRSNTCCYAFCQTIPGVSFE